MIWGEIDIILRYIWAPYCLGAHILNYNKGDFFMNGKTNVPIEKVVYDLVDKNVKSFVGKYQDIKEKLVIKDVDELDNIELKKVKND